MAINFLNTVAVDDSVLFVDTVNDRVGIGVENPGASLEIGGLAADSAGLKLSSPGSEVNVNFTFIIGDTGLGLNPKNLVIKGSSGSSDIAFSPSSSYPALMMLDGSAGNVGIGVTNPAYKLHVGGAVYSSSTIGNLTAGSLGQQMELGNAAVTTFRFDANRWRLYAGASAGEVFTVEETGNVGINNTGPDYKLEVNGTFGVSDLPFNTDSVSVLVADETLGPELTTNGDFAIDADWSKGSGVTIASGVCTWTNTVNNVGLYQSITFTANAYYKCNVTVSNYSSGSFRFRYPGISSPIITANGTYSLIIKADQSANSTLYLQGETNGDANVNFSIDNVSVKQVTSASNQIQKRELGTGAFGPTPVGAYLPLSAGSGSPLTGTLYGTSTNFSGSGDYAGSMILGNGASTAEAHLTIGQGRTDSGYSYIDLVGGTTYSDYGLRIIRNNTGANTSSAIIHRGTGNLEISTVESSSVLFKTNNTSAFTLTNTQNAIFDGYVCIGGTNPGANLEIRGTVNTDDCKIYLKENSVYGAYFKYDGDLNRGYIGGITSTTSENAVLSWSRDGSELKLVTSGSTAVTIDSNRDVTFAEDIIIKEVLLSNQENTDIDSAAAEVVALVAHATYTAAFFDFVVKKGTNVRSGTVYACHNGDTTPLVEFTETSTNDLGDTSDVTLSVDISGDNMRLLATVTSNDWSVKSLIRAI